MTSGVVVVDTRIQGRGRPTQLYRLTRDFNRHSLDALTGAVLNVWLGNVTETEREGGLRKIADSLTAKWNYSGSNLTQRLTYTVRRLNEMNFLARWEAHIDAPRILMTHCPFALVVTNHPEICQMDAFMVSNLLGQPVTRISSMTGCATGGIQCIFRLDPKALTLDTRAIGK